MKEIERKFLFVGTDPIESDLKLIKQGYFMVNSFRHVRIRICDFKAILGLKITEGLVRQEYEEIISLADGIEIYGTCKYKLEKKRFTFTLHGYHCDVDMYPNGLKVIEVEFESVGSGLNFDKFLKTIVAKQFFGKEITNDKKYSNINLAKQNLKF